MRKGDRQWSRADVAHLRWYAERGLSMNEAAKLLDRTGHAVAIKAGALGVHFSGPSGAPFGNRNGAVAWYSDTSPAHRRRAE